MEGGLRLLSIDDSELHQMITERNFSLARECGDGAEGLSLSLTVGYIDALILSQNTLFNNYKFLEEK